MENQGEAVRLYRCAGCREEQTRPDRDDPRPCTICGWDLAMCTYRLETPKDKYARD